MMKPVERVKETGACAVQGEVKLDLKKSLYRSFDAPKPLKRLLIFIGVLVGMGGPSNI